MSEKDILFIYGLSKMTISNENDDEKKYFTIHFVEFLEMVGRCAAFKC